MKRKEEPRFLVIPSKLKAEWCTEICNGKYKYIYSYIDEREYAGQWN